MAQLIGELARRISEATSKLAAFTGNPQNRLRVENNEALGNQYPSLV